MSYRFISDPGHGWLEVPLAELRALGIANAISPYSYVSGSMAYLEEDCDASLFADVYEREHGERVTYRAESLNVDAPIRRYRSYPLDPAWQVHAVAARAPRPLRAMPVHQEALL